MGIEVLKDAVLKTAKPKDKAFRLNDGGGLYLLIQPNGAKWWRLDYTLAGKRKTLSMGVYPNVTLATARARAKEHREQVANGIDPSDTRKAAKAEQVKALDAQNRIEAGLPAVDSFEAIAREWMEGRKSTVALGQYEKSLSRMVNDVFPWMVKRPIADIDAPEILVVMRRIDGRGARFTAHRVRSEISRVFLYAIATGRAKSDPARDLIGAIPPAVEKHS